MDVRNFINPFTRQIEFLQNWRSALQPDPFKLRSIKFKLWGKQRDCSQTRPKSITKLLTSMKTLYFLQALMRKAFPRAIFWIWWMMSVWDFLQHLINVTIESILEVWQMGALNGNFIFCKYSWIWISPKCCIVPRFHSSVQSCRS